MYATPLPRPPVARLQSLAPPIPSKPLLSAREKPADHARDTRPARRILVATQLAHSAFLKGLTRFAKERRWQLITDMLHTGNMPKRWDGDGIIAFAPYQSDIAAYVAGTDMPCVTVSMTDECSAVPRIQPDNIEIGRLAAQHLVERNIRRFLWAPYIDDRQNQERLAGFLEVAESLGCPCDELPPAHLKLGAYWHENWMEWRRSVQERLSQASRPVGIFAFNDCLSVELSVIASELGLRVPEDLAIVGVGNEEIECQSASISLSSVDPDLEEMSYQAALLLAKRLDGSEPADDVLRVPPRRVVQRESTAVRSLNNPRLETALAYILKNYPDPNLSVTSVADAIEISRRQLERDFRSEMGHTVRERIERARMDEAARLLIEMPNASISKIAKRVGISASGNFFRIFRKRFGLTPSEFRAQAAPASAKQSERSHR